MNEQQREALVTCWRLKGISGDLSCPKLIELVHCRNCPEYNRAGRQLFDRDIPRGFLEEWTQNLMGAKETEPLDAVSVIIFRIRNEWLAFKTFFLQETVSVRTVHYVPFRSNNVFRGIVNVNGELLLCVSALDLFEVSPEREEVVSEKIVYERMLVIDKGGERYVFPVDEVLGIHRMPLSHLHEPPVTLSKAPTNLVKGIFELKEKRIGFLDEEKFCQSLRRSCLA
jgi:chemotaxis-related protein WspD